MTTPQSALIIEAILAIPLVLIGISHILQKRMWLEFFEWLAAKDSIGVVIRTFLFELWPATLVVVFHQEWTWPGVVITLYGHLLMFKVVLSLLVPSIGVKSLKQSQTRGDNTFIVAGIGLIILGLFCGARALLAN